MSVGSLWLGCLSAEQLHRQGQSTTCSSWPAPRGVRNARWGGGMWHVRHQGGPLELCTPARSDRHVLLGVSQNPNCSNAAGKAVANDMQLTCSFDRPECLECSSHGTCRMARLTCQMHCHLLGLCVEPRGNTHGTPRIQCYFPKAVLSPAAVTTDRARDPCVTGAQIRLAQQQGRLASLKRACCASVD